MKNIHFRELAGKGGDIGKIILSRPQKLNALNLEMCQAIRQHLQDWSEKKSIKAVIISSESPRAFCAGGDVLSLYEYCVRGEYEVVDAFFKTEYAMNQAIFSFNKPYLAFLDGITMGGGVGVSIHGSHPLATERLVWAMPETSIGFFPDVGVGYHLAQLPDFLGNFLALTGERLGADLAYALGMVKAIIPSSRLSELEVTLLETPFESSQREKIRQILDNFHNTPTPALPLRNSPSPSQGEGWGGGDLLPHSLEKANIIEKMKKIFSANSVEEIFHRCSSEQDPWSQKLMTKLKTLSPLSLKITFEHLQRCRKNKFTQVMAENSVLAKHFIRNPNFMEGIRAALVDKDQRPHWNPFSIEEVTPNLVRSFFEF